MPNSLAARHVALASTRAHSIADHAPAHDGPHGHHDIAAEWQAHVDAGRIGNRPPMSPAIRANLARTEALFAALAEERRA